MTAYQLLPALDPEQYDALRADIKAHGIRVPVDVDDNGQVLDGHHRSLIAAELGIDCPRRTVPGLTEPQKIAHAIAVNAHRRHLTREQKRDLLAASIKAEPEASDVEHARRTGSSDKTAAAVRRDLEATSEVPRLDSRRGADGRTRPASQPPRPQSSPAPVQVEATPPALSPGAGEPNVPDLTGVAMSRERFLAQRRNGEVTAPPDEPWQPDPPSEAARQAEAARISAEAWSQNLAKWTTPLARMAPAVDLADDYAAKFLPASAASYGGVSRQTLRDAARFLLALADVWKDEAA